MQNCNFIKAGQPQWPFCQGASLALASVILALSWPVGLLETIFRAIPRRRSRALRCSSARGWPAGLPETIFRATANFCDSLPRARFRYFGAGGWPDELPETSFRAMKAEGSWNASGRNGRFINQKRTSGQIFKFGLRMADFILSRIRSLSAAKPSHFYQGLAEGQLYQGRPAAVAVYQNRWQFYQGRPAYRAVARARSVVPALGAGPSGFPKQFSGRRPISATASLALASVILALGGGRTGLPKQVSER